MDRKERFAYMYKELMATGRKELIDAVERGEISIAMALKIAKPAKYDRKSAGLQTLMLAWEMATDTDRDEFRNLISPTSRQA